MKKLLCLLLRHPINLSNYCPRCGKLRPLNRRTRR